MTVNDFNQKQRDVGTARKNLKDGLEKIGNVFKILQDKKNKDKTAAELLDLLRPDLNAAIVAGNAAVAQLGSYENLMDDIARRTELDWPPSCGKGKP